MHLEKNSLLLSAFLVLGIAGSARADIVGGDEVSAKDPIRGSTVALYEPSSSGPGGALCTASLIGNDMALTAAHCVQPGGPAPVLLFGRDIHAPDTVQRRATAVRVNPRWRTHQGKGMDEGDIALVKFGGGLPEGYRTVQPMESDAGLKSGGSAVLAGYGITDARTHAGAGVLRRARVRIANSRPGKTEMVLDQSHGQGACHGDSGGPAFVRQGGKTVLAGVTNRSYPAGAADDCGHQVVYTKVGAYRNWIRQGEKELRSSPRAAAPLSAKWRKSRGGLRRKVAHRAIRHASRVRRKG